MPNVNLIAARRAEKKRVEKNTRRLFFGLAVEVGVLVLLGSYIGARQIALRGALTEANTRMQKLQPTLDRIAQIEKDTTILKPKVDTLLGAKADTLRWRAMLQIVSLSVPSNAWLTSITSQGSGADTTITISGNAGTQTIVGETMTRLGSFPVFDKIDLRFTQLSSAPTDVVPRFTFEIGAHLKSTRPVEAAPGDGTPAGETKQAQEGGTPHGKPNA